MGMVREEVSMSKTCTFAFSSCDWRSVLSVPYEFLMGPECV